MLSNISNNTDIALSSKLIKQDSLNKILGSNIPTKKGVAQNVSEFLLDSSDISNTAMKMYERELDIRNFTQLATSNPENESHNKLVEKLFANGIVDVFEDETVASLAGNKSLLNDLGL